MRVLCMPVQRIQHMMPYLHFDLTRALRLKGRNTKFADALGAATSLSFCGAFRRSVPHYRMLGTQGRVEDDYTAAKGLLHHQRRGLPDWSRSPECASSNRSAQRCLCCCQHHLSRCKLGSLALGQRSHSRPSLCRCLFQHQAPLSSIRSMQGRGRSSRASCCQCCHPPPSARPAPRPAVRANGCHLFNRNRRRLLLAWPGLSTRRSDRRHSSASGGAPPSCVGLLNGMLSHAACGLKSCHGAPRVQHGTPHVAHMVRVCALRTAAGKGLWVRWVTNSF